jgi:preprotein translocase subunit SecF
MSFLTRIDYMKSARYWIYLSITLTVLSVVAIFSLGLKKGIDFTGGIQLDVQYAGDVTQAQVDSAVAKVIGESRYVQMTEAKGEHQSGFLITVPEISDAKKADLLKALEAVGPSFKLAGEDNVSGSVSNELTQKAAMAIAIAAVLQIIYIGIRFDLKFGVTAVVALLHDVVITLGLMSILRIEINSPFVAAILTVLGYSMNDSVVVIDRIRENLPKRGKKESIEALVTRSMQEVIHRSLYTVATTEIALLALIALGGDSIRDFVMTMFIGITLGAYSSIFICSALWLYWTKWEEQRQGQNAGSAGKKPKGKLKPSKA